MEEIMVSVCCLAYNHEKYIRQALDGFLMQKTNFKFEVLIHDDASTDGTADIIREYEKKYPDIIKPIYQKENQYSKRVLICSEILYPLAKGKYIALCEGDDYWIDEYKLQKQYDCLERNPDCVFCTHTVRSVSESGSKLEEIHPHNDMKEGMVDSDKWIRTLLGNLPYQFQTSCYFFRSDIVKRNGNNIPDFIRKAKVGDAVLMMLCAYEGNLYYLKEEMSCYRKSHSGSWSTQFANDINLQKNVIEAAIKSFNAYDEFTGYKYTKEINEKCLREEFKLLIIEKQYKSMLKKRYRELYKELSKKEQIYYSIFGVMPHLEGIYKKLKRK